MSQKGKPFLFFVAGFALGSVWMLLAGILFQSSGRGRELRRIYLARLLINDTPEVQLIQNKIHKGVQPRVAQDQKRTVLYTLHRSGSTFAGEMFAQHPDVYYTYEPFQLYPFSVETKQEHINQEGERFLSGLLRCVPCPLIQDVEAFHANGKERIHHWAPTVFCYGESNQSFKDNSKILSCKTNNSSNCNPYSIHQIQQRCHSKRHVVSKLVTLKNFTSLLSLMRKGVTVIHLVRDPRGQLESIRRRRTIFDIYRRMSIIERAKHVCQVLREGLLQSSEALTVDRSVQENYRRVRYEDIAQRPQHYNKQMYDFVGLNQNSHVLKWLKKSTRSKKDNVTSNDQAWSWRRRIPYRHVVIIQAMCEDVMEELGYIAVRSTQHLRNLTDSLHGALNDSYVWL